MDNNHGFAKNYYKNAQTKSATVHSLHTFHFRLNFTFSRGLGKIFLIFTNYCGCLLRGHLINNCQTYHLTLNISWRLQDSVDWCCLIQIWWHLFSSQEKLSKKRTLPPPPLTTNPPPPSPPPPPPSPSYLWRSSWAAPILGRGNSWLRRLLLLLHHLVQVLIHRNLNKTK